MEVRKAVKTVGIYWLSIGFLPGYIYPGRLRAAKDSQNIIYQFAMLNLPIRNA